MPYHAVYVLPEPTPPVDGPGVASSMGYHDFGTYVEKYASRFPTVAHLVEHGYVDESQPGTLSKLASELAAVERSCGPTNPNEGHVARLLFDALQSSPPGTVGLLVSDGEPGDDSPLEGEPPQSDIYG